MIILAPGFSIDPWMIGDAAIYLAFLVVLTRGGNLACRGLLVMSGITPPAVSSTTSSTPAVLAAPASSTATPPAPSAPSPAPASPAPTAGPVVTPSTPTPASQNTAPATSAGAGRMIGSLERAIILLGLAAGSWEIIAAVIALKTVGRFKELDERLQAEYFLIGSLASIVWAGLVSLALLQFDGTLGFHIADLLRAAKPD
jgi:hypothetical protein